MKSQQTFSWKGRFRSFRFAWAGLCRFFRLEHNARLHLLGTLFAVTMLIGLPLTTGESMALVVVTGMVWMAEIFNTSIERIMDFLTKEKREEVKAIKDLAAAAVLVSAVTALLTAVIILYAKI